MATDTEPSLADLRRTALAHHQGGALAQAQELYLEILQAEPEDADALHGLGVIAYQRGDWDAAVNHIRRALASRPDFAEARKNLGVILAAAGRHEEAADALRQAPPHSREAHTQRGRALAALGRYDEALPAFREAVRLSPEDPVAHHDLGTVHKLLGRLDEALASFANAVRLQPDYALTHVNRATVWLMQGDFARGWAEYEWRWRLPALSPRMFPQPLWDGGPLHGRTILLHAEQGLGDTLQFVRYAALVRRQGGRVLLSCPARLHPLLSGCAGLDALLSDQGPLPQFDVYAPLLSLPFLLRTTLGSVPAEVPYLAADPALVERWRGRLAKVRGLRVGVCWQGNPNHAEDRQRSFPLAQLKPLACVPDVSLVSLQNGPGAEQVAQVAADFAVVDLGAGVDAEAGAFMDTAAVIRNLDLVITADTAIAHLAGALGAPVWVALGAAADWRWLLGREDNPWYPTLRLFRQPAVGDWSSVFSRMASELSGLRRRGAP